MGARVTVSLACAVCRARNYKTTRASRPSDKPFELKKYCKVCKAHTIHRESK